jgi:hypothetical protein
MQRWRVLRWLTVAYTPRPEEQGYLGRAQTRKQADLEVTLAVLGDRESHRFFGVRMARRGMQPLWVRVVNRSKEAHRLDLLAIDASYYTPLEAAYVNHYSLGKHLLSFGLLAWLYLPLLPLLVFKVIGARGANRRMNAFFKEHGFSSGAIRPGAERSGFVFTGLDEGMKNVEVKLLAGDHVQEFSFSVEVPGLDVRTEEDEADETRERKEVNAAGLRSWLEGQPRCTSNKRGSAEGDPLNLVVVGDRASVLQCFGARWDEAEAITLATCWKTFKAFFLDSGYRYSPVSPLFLDGRQQELALQRARASINERIHLRLWRAPLAFEGQRVWIGQVSRDIGVRFTPRTWNLTTHKIDPDVDEARDYVGDDLMAAGRVSRLGHVAGVEAAPPEAPRRNLTGDPYFTDGSRAVLILSRSRAQPAFFSWE